MGPPCSGKSTIIKEWQKKGGLVLPEFLEPAPDFINNSWLEGVGSQIRAQEWVIEQHLKKDEIIQTLVGDEPLLVERSPLDAVVYGRALGKIVAELTEPIVAKQTWTQGALILLTTDSDLLRRRWIQTRNLSPEGWDQQWGPFSQSLQQHYSFFEKTFGIPTLSTGIPIDQTMGRLEILIERGGTYGIESLLKPLSQKEKK